MLLALAQFLMTVDASVMNVSIGALVDDLDTTVTAIQQKNTKLVQMTSHRLQSKAAPFTVVPVGSIKACGARRQAAGGMPSPG